MGLDYSEKLMRAEIEKIPDGTYVFADYLDNDGIDKDRPVKIHVKVTVEGSDITMDYSGSDAQVRGPANCVLGGGPFGHLLRDVQPHRSELSPRTTAATGRSPSSPPRAWW